jgi:glycogen operon protein
MLSQGVPMLVMGDEARQTQYGNNNAYCQDNEITWFDWTQIDAHSDLVRFASELIAFRKANGTLRRARFFNGDVNARGLADITWHGCRLYSPGWDDPGSKVLAFTIGGFPNKSTARGSDGDTDIHVMMNMDWMDLEFDVPPVDGRHWYRAIDTSAASPEDIFEAGLEPLFSGDTYTVKNRSIAVLISRP